MSSWEETSGGDPEHTERMNYPSQRMSWDLPQDVYLACCHRDPDPTISLSIIHRTLFTMSMFAYC